MPKELKVKTEKQQSVHYVNNREFSLAVNEYVKQANEAIDKGNEAPQISNYIGDCFLKICEGLSRKPNFIRYSYRDEMVMDAVENCVKAICGFDRNKFEKRKAKVTDMFQDDLTEDELKSLGKTHGSPTKSVHRWYREWVASNGQAKCAKNTVPNAFAYFTQIAYFAFLRRIAKEKRQWDIKLKYIESASMEAFADFGLDEHHDGDSLIAKIRGRTSSISHRDDSFIEDDDKAPVKQVKRGWSKKVKAVTTATLF